MEAHDRPPPGPNELPARQASFGSRVAALVRARSNLAVGVAPSTKWLSAWGLSDDIEGAHRYCDIVSEGCADQVAAVKIQTPFFERFGVPGLQLLASIVTACQQGGALAIADAKRGDAGDTMDAIATAQLDRTGLGADGVTAVAYMGLATLVPLSQRAMDLGAGVLVLVRTSNHGAGELQLARHDGIAVSEYLCDRITATNATLDDQPIGPLGAVVGAPPDEAATLIARLPRSVVSYPGLGRPGRTIQDTVAAVGDAADRLLLPVTTGVLRDGPKAFGSSVRRWCDDIATGFDR